MRWTAYSLFLCLFIVPFSMAENCGIDVTNLGAVGDGKADCTDAFHKAMDKMKDAGGTVFVPAGQYAIKGTLKMPSGVSIKGTWQGPHFPQMKQGTTLLAYSGRGDESSTPFIQMGHSCTLDGLTIFYPEQKFDDIKPYPWTIQAYGSRFNIYNITIVNAYNGIDAGTMGNEGHNMRDIQICALRRGVYIDRTTDIGRLENIHVHSVNWWKAVDPERAQELAEKVNEFTRKNLEGFIVGRCDWEYMTNCFVIWPKIGFHFIETPPLADGSQHLKGQANIVITQSGSDIGPLAVKIDKVQDHAGIAFENSQFMNGVEIGRENTGPVKFSNCGFWGKTRTGSFILNHGKGTIMAANCHFSAGATTPDYKWDPNVPFFHFSDGALMMSNCLIKEYGHTPKTHVLLEKNVRSAVLIGNRIQGNHLRLKNECSANVEMIGNLYEGR